jgi:hypothetical protein
MFLAEEALAQGELIAPSKANDYKVIKASASAGNALGTAYQSVGAGEFVEVVIAARALVLMKDSTAVAHGDILYASGTAGRVGVSSAEGGVIGVALETVSGGTDVLIWAHIYLQPNVRTLNVDSITAALGSFGTSPNYTSFEADGTMVAHGAATAWEDILPYSINPGTGLTALGSKQYGTTGFKWYFFSNNAAADETFQAFFQIPHRRLADSNIHLHLHVCPSANGTAGNEVVRFYVEYQWVNIGGAYNSSANSNIAAQSFTVGAAEGNTHLLWDLGDITGTGKTLSGDLMVAVTRLTKTDAADNYTGDVYLRFVDCHCEFDTLGSRTEFSK